VEDEYWAGVLCTYLPFQGLAGVINVDLLLVFFVFSDPHTGTVYCSVVKRDPEGKKVRNLRIRNKSFGPGFGSGFKTGFETGSETGSETFISVPDRIGIKTFKRIGSRIRIITFDI
jgi:hypothetical protein